MLIELWVTKILVWGSLAAVAVLLGLTALGLYLERRLGPVDGNDNGESRG